MATHDPLRFTAGLSAKLATRSRHVSVFLGAGAARTCGLPDMGQLQERVVESLDDAQKSQFAGFLQRGNLEQALSRLRRIVALLEGDQTFQGLTESEARNLDAAVCQAIVGALDIAERDLSPMEDFAAWAARASYRLPLEVFTVNYDLLLETALESTGVPFFDGFLGALRARFHTELVENISGRDGEWMPAFFVRLWKLHGSVNWVREQNKEIVRLGRPAAEGSAAAIYPSDTKYEESRRVPFVVLQDRFRRALHEPESLSLVAGYSFGDAHLNELIFDAAIRRERSEIVVFCYSDIPDVLANRAARAPNLQVVSGSEAILGGVRGSWANPDGETSPVWIDGQFSLRDFRHLAGHLARCVSREGESEAGQRGTSEVGRGASAAESSRGPNA